MLVTIIPAETWHDCDHLHVQHADDSESQLQEDHQCDICDFHFSGYHFDVPESEIAVSEIISSQTCFYRSISCENATGISASRAPPVLA